MKLFDHQRQVRSRVCPIFEWRAFHGFVWFAFGLKCITSSLFPRPSIACALVCGQRRFLFYSHCRNQRDEYLQHVGQEFEKIPSFPQWDWRLEFIPVGKTTKIDEHTITRTPFGDLVVISLTVQMNPISNPSLYLDQDGVRFQPFHCPISRRMITALGRVESGEGQKPTIFKGHLCPMSFICILPMPSACGEKHSVRATCC